MHRKTGLHPERPRQEPVERAEPSVQAAESGLFDQNMLAQLNTVFSRMAAPLVLNLELDEQPTSMELKHYIEELASLTDKLTLKIASDVSNAPCVSKYWAVE